MSSLGPRSLRGPTTFLCLLTSSALIAACGSAGGGAGNAAGTASSSAGAAASSGSCAAGAAASGSTYTVPQEPDSGVNTPAGKCWASIKPTPMNVTDVGTLPSGESAEFWIAWSAQDLYIRAYATTWPLENNGGANWWQSDATEFDVSGTDGHGGVFSNGDKYQIAITSDGVLQTSGVNGSAASPAPTPKVQIVNNKGWYSELIVPWATLQVKPAKGGKYEFDIGEDFGDSSGNRVAQMAWQATPGGTNDWHDDTSQWGDIVLG